ncbi:MAG: hypothetical protein C4321_01510 [Chloroflexota bacterium]
MARARGCFDFDGGELRNGSVRRWYAAAMPEYQIKIIDAFTTRPYTGNPCGVITRADGLSEEQMQQIARELNASETAFVFPSRRAKFRVRFFTPTKEIPLTGHPTIATMHALVEEGRIDLSGGPVRVTQELNIGLLPVDIYLDEERNIRVVMTQARPEFGRRLDRNVIAEGLGIAPSDICSDSPVQVVSTGTPQAMVPVRSLEVLRRLKPNFQQMAPSATWRRSGITSVRTCSASKRSNRGTGRTPDISRRALALPRTR